LIARISRMAEGSSILQLQNMIFLSGWHFHCKLSAIWIRYCGATDAWKSQHCCSCQYIYSLSWRASWFFWATRHTTACLDIEESLHGSVSLKMKYNISKMLKSHVTVVTIYFESWSWWTYLGCHQWCGPCVIQFKNVCNKAKHLHKLLGYVFKCHQTPYM